MLKDEGEGEVAPAADFPVVVVAEPRDRRPPRHAPLPSQRLDSPKPNAPPSFNAPKVAVEERISTGQAWRNAPVLGPRRCLNRRNDHQERGIAPVVEILDRAIGPVAASGLVSRIGQAPAIPASATVPVAAIPASATVPVAAIPASAIGQVAAIPASAIGQEWATGPTSATDRGRVLPVEPETDRL